MAGNGVRSDLVTRSVAPALSPAPTVSNGSLDLQLHVNASSGDVTLSDANQTSAVSFVSYTILVNDKSINTLLVGNPADKSKGTGPTGVAPRTKSPPFTGEKLLRAIPAVPRPSRIRTATVFRQVPGRRPWTDSMVRRAPSV
jgi:hypothetical protein